MNRGVSSMHGEGDGRRESPVPTSTILLAVDGGRRGPQSTAFCASATRTGEGNRRAGGRRSGGFGGKRTAARPGSSSRREKKDPSFTTSRADILSGLKVDLSSAAAPAARPSAPAAAPSHGRRRGPAPAVPKARPGSRDGLSSDFVMARPVTPELNTTAGIGYRARGGGAAFPTRKAWHTNLPRASSADGGSRRSSRMEPDSPIYIRSLDWEPTRHAPEPEPGPPACVAPTGRVFQAECTEKQRERDLAAIHAKYSGSNAMEAAAAATAEEEPQALLCPKHRAEQDPKEAEAAPNSRTQSVSFLFCGDCFAVQAAQKQQQAEDERKAQQAAEGADPIRQAAELKYGKSIAGRMLGDEGEAGQLPNKTSRSASLSRKQQQKDGREGRSYDAWARGEPVTSIDFLRDHPPNPRAALPVPQAGPVPREPRSLSQRASSGWSPLDEAH